MTYLVSYETDTEPTDLPPGAKVERKSLLPFTLVTGRSLKRFGVQMSIYDNVLLEYPTHGRDAVLTLDEAGRLRDALTEATQGTPLPRDTDVSLPVTVQTPIHRKIEVMGSPYDGSIVLRVEDTVGEYSIQAVLSRDESHKIGMALLSD